MGGQPFNFEDSVLVNDVPREVLQLNAPDGLRNPRSSRLKKGRSSRHADGWIFEAVMRLPTFIREFPRRHISGDESTCFFSG